MNTLSDQAHIMYYYYYRKIEIQIFSINRIHFKVRGSNVYLRSSVHVGPI